MTTYYNESSAPAASASASAAAAASPVIAQRHIDFQLLKGI